MIRPDRWRLSEAAPLLLVLLSAMVVFSSTAPRVPAWGDEGRYIYNTRFFDYIFLERDTTRPEWGDNYWTHNHPKLTMYVLGAWLRARGYGQERSPLPYDWAKGPDTNRAEGRVPDAPLLMAARAPMVALDVATMGVLYLLGRFLAGRIAGLVAVALALASPFARWTLVMVQSDVPLLLFVLLALLVGLVGARRGRRGELRTSWGLALGMALGLALSSKLTAAFSLLAVAAWGLLATGLAARREAGPLLARLQTGWQVGRGWALALAVASLVFVLSDPHLYPNPLVHTVHMLQHRRDEMDLQQHYVYWTATHSLLERLAYVFRGSLFRETWSGSNGFPLETVLAAVGFASLAVASYRHLRRTGQLPSEGLLLLTTLVYFFGISAGLLLAWPKYVLPSFLLGTLLSSTGVVVLAGRLRTLLPQPLRAASRPDVPA
jgi:4-amino-4-deoxy-L-arabinose transferase-like glycosyltransferase